MTENKQTNSALQGWFTNSFHLHVAHAGFPKMHDNKANYFFNTHMCNILLFIEVLLHAYTVLNYNTFSLHPNDRPSYNVGTKCNRFICTDTNSAKKYKYTLFLKDQYLSTYTCLCFPNLENEK